MKNIKKLGISLIVLVITIIIIIILAGAIILSLSDSNPIESANKAKFVSDVSTYKSDLALKILNEYSQTMGVFDPKTISATGDELKKYIPSMKETDKTKFEIKAGQLNILSSASALEKEWFLENNGTVVELPKYTNVKAESKYNIPYIPVGFKYVTGTYDTGIVIEDIGSTDARRGNQFTWVPVQNFADFKRTDFNKGDSMNVATDYTGESVYNGVDTDGSELSNIYKSVKTYGGFYVGRYEASDETNITISKAGKSVWNNITWGTNAGTDRLSDPGTPGAVSSARSLYTDKTDIASNLGYGVQWDTTLKFIETKAPGYATDSTDMGNYTRAIASTGSNTSYMKNNISDMAGNVREWTMEGCNSTDLVSHGGDYFTNGSYDPASHRGYDEISFCNDKIGFRAWLYIK